MHDLSDKVGQLLSDITKLEELSTKAYKVIAEKHTYKQYANRILNFVDTYKDMKKIAKYSL